jgi:hypothetical protein
MVLYLINIGLSVGIFSLQVLVSFGLERWSSRQRKRAFAETKVRDVVPLPNSTYHEAWQLAKARSQRHARLRRWQAYSALVVALNVATAFAVTVPLLFAVTNLHDRNQQQALDFNLLGLAVLIVTKGSLSLLILALLPAVRASPTAVTGGDHLEEGQ